MHVYKIFLKTYFILVILVDFLLNFTKLGSAETNRIQVDYLGLSHYLLSLADEPHVEELHLGPELGHEAVGHFKSVTV